jgi:putative FmdB family regulatory protein
VWLAQNHRHLLHLSVDSTTLALDVPTGQGAIFTNIGSNFAARAADVPMPIYEYRCAACRRRVSLYYQTFSAASAATPTCSHCGSTNLSRLVSRVFQLKSEDAQLEDLADPSSFGDLDENDPKSVARWARKLGQQMGEDLGDDWGEMVDRLEAGEDLGEEGDGEGAGASDPDGVGSDSSDL